MRYFWAAYVEMERSYEYDKKERHKHAQRESLLDRVTVVSEGKQTFIYYNGQRFVKENDCGK